MLDVLAFMFVPPYPKDEPGHAGHGHRRPHQRQPRDPCPASSSSTWPRTRTPAHPVLVGFHPSITAPIVHDLAGHGWSCSSSGSCPPAGCATCPGRYQNFIELTFEKLEDWAVSLGGEPARKHIPVFTAFFLFILVSNWSGLIPVFGKIEALRAPTSDVNVTFGLALVVFFYFQYQGFRALGVRHYLGKFFVFSGFKDGLGAGFIGLFVGLIEFMLEFIKPITLSMRLFGNIFGGEVALGVITALTIAAIPSIMMLLEGLLNFIQALIFSTPDAHVHRHRDGKP